MILKRLGAFVVLEEVSHRVFSVTYRAEQPDLGRTVLLRALKSSVSVTSPFAEELAREASVLAKLEHPSIVRLYEFVRTADSAFLVLEDRRGVPLSTLAARVRLAPDQAAAIALEVARALGHAHERGIVHRGLTPAILEITREGSVCIVEFAAAHAERMPSLPEPIEIGDQGARPDFLSPEQILGEEVGPRSDVFALGVLLHWLASGVLPFEAGIAKEVAQRVRNDSPAPIPGLPRELERVLALCLAKNPDDRFEDGRAVAAAIETALAELGAQSPAVLITQALSAANLGTAIAAPPQPRLRENAATRGRPGPSLRSATRTLPFVLGLVVAGAIVIEASRDPEARTATSLAPAAPWSSGERGYLRIVAAPWAEISIDGEHVDTTPIGRPVPVTPGRHFVTFKHPSAPDEQRTVKVLTGQTVLLDVVMRVVRPPVDAGRFDASASP